MIQITIQMIITLDKKNIFKCQFITGLAKQVYVFPISKINFLVHQGSRLTVAN